MTTSFMTKTAPQTVSGMARGAFVDRDAEGAMMLRVHDLFLK